jgi:23S rRNA (guanosine2251-2'-O)-methyltransferase
MESRSLQPNTAHRALVLYNIRSVYNVGSLFRSADGAGFTMIHLIGITPQPVDRFGRQRADLAKTALGAEHSVEWMYHESFDDFLGYFKKEYPTGLCVALEQDPKSHSYTDILLDRDLCLVLGNEVEGIPQEITTVSDMIVEIPMMGEKKSLNVSVAGSIVMYDIMRRSIK